MNILSKKLACFPVLVAKFVGLSVLSTVVFAEEYDSLKMGVGATVSHDSNLYRLNAAYPGGVQADTTTDAYVFLTVDKTFSRQSFSGSFQFDRISFNRNPTLNYDAQKLAARWRADLPGETTLELGGSRATTLAKFSDFSGESRKNIITRNALDVKIDVPITPALHALVIARAERRRDSDPLQQGQSTNNESVGGGVSYRTGSGNHVDLMGQAGRTRYPNLSYGWTTGDNGLRDRSARIVVGWSFSPFNRVDADVGYYQRNNDHLDIHNFSGVNAHLAHTWNPTVTTAMRTTLARTVGAAGDNSFNYAVTQTVRVEPSWQVRPKIRLGAMAEWNQRKYDGRISLPDLLSALISQYGTETGVSAFQSYLGAGYTGVPRSDKTVLAGLTTAYDPFNWGRITISYNFEKRTSNLSLVGYTDRVVAMTLQAQF